MANWLTVQYLWYSSVFSNVAFSSEKWRFPRWCVRLLDWLKVHDFASGLREKYSCPNSRPCILIQLQCSHASSDAVDKFVNAVHLARCTDIELRYICNDLCCPSLSFPTGLLRRSLGSMHNVCYLNFLLPCAGVWMERRNCEWFWYSKQCHHNSAFTADERLSPSIAKG